MKVWINRASCTCAWCGLHWTEPSWYHKDGASYWKSTADYCWLDNDAIQRIFHLKEIPQKDECWEIDLSGKPKVVEVWVPCEQEADDVD